MLSGIDFSETNGVVNWKNISIDDVNFAYFKATEGLDSVDQAFEFNIEAAKGSNILYGVYHVLHPGLHVGQQADFFFETVSDFRNMLPPTVCLIDDKSQPDQYEKNINAFTEIIFRKLGVKPIIYTSQNFWQDFMNTSSWACECPLWLDQPGNNWPKQIYPWAGWTFWQFSYQSSMPSIPNYLGFNWFNGSEKELQAMVIQ